VRAGQGLARAAERQDAGQRLEGQDRERVLVGAAVDLVGAPELGRHVRRRAEDRAGLGLSRRIGPDVDGHPLLVVDGRVAGRDLGRRTQRARALDELGDAEVEELGQEPSGARQHHDVARLEVAVDHALLVRGVHDLADPIEEGDQPLERQPALRVEQAVQRGAAHELHRDPEHAVGLVAELVDVRGVGVIEPRRELGLA
jgi:hypothetical protein